jgi:SAM-dependent methyltransferase
VRTRDILAGVDDYLDQWDWLIDPAGTRMKCLLSAVLVTTPRELRDELTPWVKDLERRWYDSLDRGSPDYGVYDDDDYIPELWAAWVGYSSDRLRDISRLQYDGTIPEDLTSIGDLGNGAGLTTRVLSEWWPKARVYGTNRSPRQVEAARSIGVHVVAEPEPADLVLASEYFEHFEQPVQHLNDVLDAANPRMMMVANSFGSRSIGHFDRYLVGGKEVSGASASRAFGATMRAQGYERLDLGFWNNRPAVWVRS